ncbi:MAG: hypothetical protein A3E01_04540 [Gammaproteobacteria bacterium RIFCSPHIGHO2_12_FULL_63_22]|nr:MAG: hypothetical protein A3E01_04540 [Gammaproteobacteria bacterium RIFCSPHIGHO2_12_FULL_63_22]
MDAATGAAEVTAVIRNPYTQGIAAYVQREMERQYATKTVTPPMRPDTERIPGRDPLDDDAVDDSGTHKLSQNEE